MNTASLTQYFTKQGVTLTQQGAAYVLPPPGVSIRQLSAFFALALKDVAGVDALLPKSFPLQGVRLQALSFTPAAGGVAAKLRCTLSWPTARWAMLPGVIELSKPLVQLEAVGQRVSGTLSGVIQVEGVPLLAQVTLPEQLFSLSLIQPEPGGAPASAAALLKSFQLSPPTGQQGGVKAGPLSIHALTIAGGARSRRGVFHLGLGELKVGPAAVAMQLSLDYAGGPKSRMTGLIWGDYAIPDASGKASLFELKLAAAYSGPQEGWQFEGRFSSGGAPSTASLADLIHAFDPKAALPAELGEASVRHFAMSYNTGTRDFSFSVEVDTSGLFAEGMTVDLIVSAKLRHLPPSSGGGAGSYETTLTGSLVFGFSDGLRMEFDAVFDQRKEGLTFIAAWKDLAGGELNLGLLTRAVAPGFDLPVTVQLKDAFFVYRRSTKTAAASTPGAMSVAGAQALFGLDIGAGIDLGHLPLVGRMFDPAQVLRVRLQTLLAMAPAPPYWTSAQLSAVQGQIPGSAVVLPSADMSTNLELLVRLQMGDTQEVIDLPIQLGASVKPQETASTPATPTPIALEGAAPRGGSNNNAGGSASARGGDGVKWIELQRAFGPVHFNRVGVQYTGGELWAYLDAELGLAGSSLSLEGLGVGTKLSPIHPTFTLEGLGLDYAQGPLEIGGAFLRTRVSTALDDAGEEVPLAKADQYWSYDGEATVKVGDLSVAAVGSYARLRGHDSLFLYATLSYPLGGPAFFFVTGLAAGFGYNRALKMPPIEGVKDFPMVAEATRGTSSGRPDLRKEMASLQRYLPPKMGQHFVAAGVKYSSFEMIDSFAMVAVRFGQHFEVDVLGLSTLKAPTPVPGSAGPPPEPLALLEMALKATFLPEEGSLGVRAQLTNASYLLSQRCHLTGGFAFYAWFKDQPSGAQAGDFVVTIGGYHPAFKPPTWYPRVPQLGFNWQVSPELFIKGDSYFALTASALMAGGHLEASWQSGDVEAWFRLGMDVLLSWKPYYYAFSASVAVRVTATVHFLGTHQINLDLGAELSIKGPDFSGDGEVHWGRLRFPIHFGAPPPAPKPIPWARFRSSFLPSDDKLLSVKVVEGVVRAEQTKDQQGAATELPVVDRKRLTLAVDAVMPFTTTKVNDALDLPLSAMVPTTRGGQRVTLPFVVVGGRYTTRGGPAAPMKPGAVAIGPMGVAAKDLSSALKLSITDGSGQDASHHFALQPVLRQAPAAMWGGALKPAADGPRFVQNTLAGLRVTPATPPKADTTLAVPKSALKFADSPGPALQTQTMTPITPASGGLTGRARVKQDVNSPSVATHRSALLSALGFTAGGALSTPSRLADDLVADPQIAASLAPATRS